MLNAARMPKADPELFMEAAKLFVKMKRYRMAVVCYDEEKIKKTGASETDWYFLGRDAYKAKLTQSPTAHWRKYANASRPPSRLSRASARQ
jgi:hypothetical protein